MENTGFGSKIKRILLKLYHFHHFFLDLTETIMISSQNKNAVVQI